MASYIDNSWNTQAIRVPYQSQLSGKVTENILSNKNIKLTPYEESMKLHMPFISSLLDFYNFVSGNDAKNCPIT